MDLAMMLTRLETDVAAIRAIACLSFLIGFVFIIGMQLAKDLKLTINLENNLEDEWLQLKLEDNLNFTEIEISYLLTPYNTLNRQYHVKEGIVIAMRRLVSEAVLQGLISEPLGVSQTWNIATKINSPITSTTDLELS